jgi:hypothetical protein
MTRLVLVVGLIVAAALLAAASPAAGDTKPLLGVSGRGPVVVRGSGFEAGERVQVLFAANGRQQWQLAVAGSGGRFTVAFRGPLGACARYVVRAFGSEGSRARAPQRRPLSDCVSPSGGSTHA